MARRKSATRAKGAGAAASTRSRSAGSGRNAALGFYSYSVSDVMSRPPLTVFAEDTLRSAAALMSRRAVSGLPIVDAAGTVVGVLSHKDVLRLLHEKAGLALPGGLFDLLLDPEEARVSDLLPNCRAVLNRTPVKEAMSHPAVTIDAGRNIDEAIRVMLEHHVNRLPVLRQGRLVGIVTRHDLLTGIGLTADALP